MAGHDLIVFLRRIDGLFAAIIACSLVFGSSASAGTTGGPIAGAHHLLPPAGNFVKNPPIQLAYPYGSWYNNIEIAQMGQKNPIEAVLEFELKP